MCPIKTEESSPLALPFSSPDPPPPPPPPDPPSCRVLLIPSVLAFRRVMIIRVSFSPGGRRAIVQAEQQQQQRPWGQGTPRPYEEEVNLTAVAIVFGSTRIGAGRGRVCVRGVCVYVCGVLSCCCCRGHLIIDHASEARRRGEGRNDMWGGGGRGGGMHSVFACLKSFDHCPRIRDIRDRREGGVTSDRGGGVLRCCLP